MDNLMKSANKNILLTSCGLYPQVITEIIYALSQQTPPVHLDEIHVITTQLGLKKIKKYLLDDKNGFFYKLCKEYGLDNTAFELSNIDVLKNAQGIELNDITSVEDNEIVANEITEVVRQLTTDLDTTLHVSLAGGRRTISYYLGYAISLFGRPQDKLSHTIVSHNYEGDDEFFYPNKTATYMTDRQGNTLNTQDAKVQLAEIPFVRLREGLPHDLLQGKTSFIQAIESIRTPQAPPKIEIDVENKLIFLNGKKLTLPPIQFAWYSWLIDRHQTLDVEDAKIAVRGDYHLEFLLWVKQLFGKEHNTYLRAKAALKDGFTIDYVSEKNSLVNKAVSNLLNEYSTHYLIRGFGKRPNTEYGLSNLITLII